MMRRQNQRLRQIHAFPEAKSASTLPEKPQNAEPN